MRRREGRGRGHTGRSARTRGEFSDTLRSLTPRELIHELWPGVMLTGKLSMQVALSVVPIVEHGKQAGLAGPCDSAQHGRRKQKSSQAIWLVRSDEQLGSGEKYA